MKAHQIFVAASLMAATILSTGCSSAASIADRQATIFNRDLSDKQLPIRYVVSENPRGGYMVSPQWAGTPGDSVTLGSTELNNDIHAAIEKHCGHKKENLVEVRLVSQKPPEFYEVWLFHDPESKRDDHLSGLSVILTQLPFGGGVNFGIRGPCHAPGGAIFTFS